MIGLYRNWFVSKFVTLLVPLVDERPFQEAVTAKCEEI